MQIYISRCGVTRSEIIARELFIRKLLFFTTRRRDCIKMETYNILCRTLKRLCASNWHSEIVIVVSSLKRPAWKTRGL